MNELSAIFDSSDKNGDGVLDPEENVMFAMKTNERDIEKGLFPD